MERKWWAVATAAVVTGALGFATCTGETAAPDPVPTPAPAEPAPAPAPPPPTGPLPALIMVQAQFLAGPDGRPKPGPARMTLYRNNGGTWLEEVIEDPDSNVFHKGMP